MKNYFAIYFVAATIIASTLTAPVKFGQAYDEKTIRNGKCILKSVGGGAATGAVSGAIVGSVVPLLGTLIGGLVGAAGGAVAGGSLGGMVASIHC